MWGHGAGRFLVEVSRTGGEGGGAGWVGGSPPPHVGQPCVLELWQQRDIRLLRKPNAWWGGGGNTFLGKVMNKGMSLAPSASMMVPHQPMIHPIHLGCMSVHPVVIPSNKVHCTTLVYFAVTCSIAKSPMNVSCWVRCFVGWLVGGGVGRLQPPPPPSPPVGVKPLFRVAGFEPRCLGPAQAPPNPPVPREKGWYGV